MKKLFETKYRIMPVYRNGKGVGFVVYQKNPFIGAWTIAPLDILVTDVIKDNEGKNIETERIEINNNPAYFKTEDEARTFSEHIKTIL